MLQLSAIDTTTLELLNKIMQDSFFDDFTLVGGTALSLSIGHRISIDLDFFITTDYDEQSLA